MVQTTQRQKYKGLGALASDCQAVFLVVRLQVIVEGSNHVVYLQQKTREVGLLEEHGMHAVC